VAARTVGPRRSIDGMRQDSPEVTPAAGTVLLVTADASVREDVERLAAAVGLTVEAVPEPGAAGRRWVETPLVLLGRDTAGLGVPVRRTGVVLVGSVPDEAVWRLAVQCGAEAVAVLPADEAWLLERLACEADGAGTPGRVLGVLGGRGGAGASTLAAGAAVAAARSGADVLLVDADPAGGGLDLLLGMESRPGLGWPDLRRVSGVLRGSLLRDGLPQDDRLRLLGWGSEPAEALPVAALEAVLDAGRRSHDLVVVDLPRSADPATVAALWRLDLLLLVVPAEVRAAATAATTVARVGPDVGASQLVVRGPAPTGLTVEAVAEAVGLPVAAVWPDEPGLAVDADRGVPPGTRPGSALGSVVRPVVAGLLADQTWPRAVA